MASIPPSLWVAIALGGCGLAGAVMLYLFCYVCPAWRFGEWRESRRSRLRVRRLSNELSQSQFVTHCATISTAAAPSFHSRVRALSQLYTRRSHGHLLRDASARERAASAPLPAAAHAGGRAAVSGTGDLADSRAHDLQFVEGDSLEEVARAALAMELSGTRSPPRIGARNVPVLQLPPAGSSPHREAHKPSRWPSPRSGGSLRASIGGSGRGTPDPSVVSSYDGRSPSLRDQRAPSRGPGLPSPLLGRSSALPLNLARSASSPAAASGWAVEHSNAGRHALTAPSPLARRGAGLTPGSGSGKTAAAAALARSRSTPMLEGAAIEMSPLRSARAAAARGRDEAPTTTMSARAQSKDEPTSRPATGGVMQHQVTIDVDADAHAVLVQPTCSTQADIASSEASLPGSTDVAQERQSAASVAAVALVPSRRQPGILVRIVDPQPTEARALRLGPASNIPRLASAALQEHAAQPSPRAGVAGAVLPQPQSQQQRIRQRGGLQSEPEDVTPNTTLAELEALEELEAHTASSGRSTVPLVGDAASAARGQPVQPLPVVPSRHYRSFTTGSMIPLAPRSASGSAPIVAVRVAAEQERRLSPRHGNVAAEQRAVERGPSADEKGDPTERAAHVLAPHERHP